MPETIIQSGRGKVTAHGKGGSGDPIIKEGRRVIILKGYGPNKPSLGSVLDYHITRVGNKGVLYAQIAKDPMNSEKIVRRDIGMGLRNKAVEKKMFVPDYNLTINHIEDLLTNDIFDNGNGQTKLRIQNGLSMIKNYRSEKKNREALASAKNLYNSILNEGNYNQKLNEGLRSIGMYNKLGNLEKQLS